MTVQQFSGLAKTAAGRTAQITRAYRGIADEMARKQTPAPDGDTLDTLTPKQLRALVRALQDKLADAQAAIDDMRASANGGHDVPATAVDYWDTRRVARESHVAICTICRNATALSGIKLGGDWVFPVGTKYGGKRKRAN